MAAAMQDDAPVRLAVGESWTTDLPGLGSAGYRWSDQVEGEAGVVSTGWSMVHPPSDEPPLAGRSAAERLLITATAPGRVRVHLNQGRAWESAAPRAQRTIEVVVSASE